MTMNFITAAYNFFREMGRQGKITLIPFCRQKATLYENRQGMHLKYRQIYKDSAYRVEPMYACAWVTTKAIVG